MALFLETHELDGRDPETFLREQSEQHPQRRCLQHWIDADGITAEVLVEAPDRAALLAATRATCVTELFAPIRRWLSDDPVYPA